MRHLGPLLSGFVDGQLGPADRERVLAHLALCAGCRSDAEVERRLKASLAGTPLPAPPARLVAALKDLPAPGTGGPRASVTAAPRPQRRRPVSPRSAARPAASGSRPRGAHGRWARRVWLGGVALGAALSAAFVAGGPVPDDHVVRPRVDRFAVEHASVTGTVPLVDPATLVQSADGGR